MSAGEIAHALGGASRSGAWWRCRCPVHGSRGATLALRVGERGLIVKCFADCDPGDILAELRRRGLVDAGPRNGGGEGLRPDAEAIRLRRKAEETERCRRIEDARRLWEAAEDAGGSRVVRYLAGRRITIAPPPVLRYAPALRRPDDSYGPAMVARVDDLNGRLIGVHRTWLARDPAGAWRRFDRASLGPIGGGAVRLAMLRPDDWLVIGEGIETVASVMQCTALPGWAALSARGIERLLLPPDVRMALIVADHDANGTGGRAAHNAARRWLREGRRVRIALPPHVAGRDQRAVVSRLREHRICRRADRRTSRDLAGRVARVPVMADAEVLPGAWRCAKRYRDAGGAQRDRSAGAVR
jgi:putative DNA primase/helicase